MLKVTFSFILIFVVTVATFGNIKSSVDPEFIVNMKNRLLRMDCLVDARLTTATSNYIQQYLVNHKASTEKLLGKSALFFPIIESFLIENKLPKELKAMAIMESWLDPEAISRSGAVGLWQFMPGTAKDFGLNFNPYVDERRDPCKSTLAAIQYLKHLYGIYEDWALTLAAYNSGPQRVNYAIERAGGFRDFWAIQQYLPSETQNYVPKYIAINYVLNYYNEHDLNPILPELDLQITAFIKTTKRVDFRTLSKITGLSVQTIESLNPSYKKNIVPKSSDGQYLIFPKRVLKKVENFLFATEDEQLLESLSSTSTVSNELLASLPYVEIDYTVGLMEDLSFIAKKYNIATSQIMLWNKLTTEYLATAQILKLYIPIDKFKRLELMIEPNKINDLPLNHNLKTTCKSNIFNLRSTLLAAKSVKKVKHVAGPFETINSILSLYPETSYEEFLAWNELKEGEAIHEGAVLLCQSNNTPVSY